MPLVVVNMIPNDRSGEQNQDSEPNITVDPLEPAADRGLGVHSQPRGEPERADLRLDRRRHDMVARVDRAELGLAGRHRGHHDPDRRVGHALRRDPAAALRHAAAEHPPHAQLHLGRRDDRARRPSAACRASGPALGRGEDRARAAREQGSTMCTSAATTGRAPPAHRSAAPRPSTARSTASARRPRRRRTSRSTASRRGRRPGSARRRRRTRRRCAPRPHPDGTVYAAFCAAALDHRLEHARLRHRGRAGRQLGERRDAVRQPHGRERRRRGPARPHRPQRAVVHVHRPGAARPEHRDRRRPAEQLDRLPRVGAI